MSTLTKDGEVMHEIASLTGDLSPTAANAQNPLYGTSGEMKYRCTFREGGHVDVVAATGDEAATKALAQRGGFVTSISPVGN